MKFLDLEMIDVEKTNRCNICMINLSDPVRNRQLGNEFLITQVTGDRPGWCVFLVDDNPSDVIAGRVDGNDVLQTAYELLGI